MNHYYLEQRSKEKINGLLAEGLRSQEYHRSLPAREGLFHASLRIILGYLSSRASLKERSVKNRKSEPAYPEA